MAINNFLKEEKRYPGWVITEQLTLLYTLVTTLLILIFWNRLDMPGQMLSTRGAVLGGILLARMLYRYFPTPLTLFLRQFYPLTLLGVWYPETYEFCRMFPYLDHWFATADQNLFGCQPALTFHQLLSGKLWSELFHMGYFAYYPMIMLTVFAALFASPRQFSRTAFVVLGSFFLYYLVYLFLPVAGPQYYFHAVGTDTIRQGVFPVIGDWFRTHTEMLPSPGPDGFFRSLIVTTQAAGERPTAAFPSSHVGISTILMFLLYRNNRKLLVPVLPFYLFLCGATVYIQAHYLIDVLGGLASAVLFYLLTDRIYPYFAKHSPESIRKE